MKTNHTPIPWSVQFTAGDLSVTCPRQQIAKLVPMVSGGEMMANAEFIVRAVNSHEALITALDELLATHELREHNGETITPLQRKAMDAAIAAISKAEGSK